MRKLAYVVKIASCEPIAGADRLSLTKMQGLGWQVVTARDEFKAGDLAVYFEIDSFLPDKDERYEFLRERCLRKFTSKSGKILDQGIRIKTIKLRGELSQGLLMPIDKYPELTDLTPGADQTEVLHVRHHDEIKEALAPVDNHAIQGSAHGEFPSLIPKTDETRCQVLADYWELYPDMEFEVTEKRDGQSITCAYSPTIDPKEPFMVCSRNIRLKRLNSNGEVNLAWQMAEKYGLDQKLKKLCEEEGLELAIQSEQQGAGIQSNPDKLTEYAWECFKMWDIKKQCYLTTDECVFFCECLDIPHVPVLANAMKVFRAYPTMDSLLEFADGFTARGNRREGLVFKQVDSSHPITFKAVSNKHLLKQG